MKILFTGCSAKQVDDNAMDRAHIDRIDDSSIIINSLRKSGHEVTRKHVKWGEDLSEYDVAIVGLGPLGSFNFARTQFGAVWTVHNHRNIICFHEDWKIKETIYSYRNVKDVSDVLKFKSRVDVNNSPIYRELSYPEFDADLDNNLNIVFNTYKDIVSGKYPCLVPGFDWGDKSILHDYLNTTNVYNVDLTPYVIEHYDINQTRSLFDIPVERKDEHMLASLGDHQGWVRKQKLNWPVSYYGSNKKFISLNSETDVFNKCKEYKGILCPKYYHAGSGWFRMRWIYAALAGSVIIGDDADHEALGVPKRNIEDMNDKEYNQYQLEQSNAIKNNMWSISDFDKNIVDIVNKVTNLTYNNK